MWGEGGAVDIRDAHADAAIVVTLDELRALVRDIMAAPPPPPEPPFPPAPRDGGGFWDYAAIIMFMLACAATGVLIYELVNRRP